LLIEKGRPESAVSLLTPLCAAFCPNRGQSAVPATPVGVAVGFAVGVDVGFTVGVAVGLALAVAVGLATGVAVGLPTDVAVGLAIGVELRAGDGVALAVELGLGVGLALDDGTAVGVPTTGGALDCDAELQLDSASAAAARSTKRSTLGEEAMGTSVAVRYVPIARREREYLCPRGSIVVSS
jgi:hypothetical protein